jgi:hypothetical protein
MMGYKLLSFLRDLPAAPRIDADSEWRLARFFAYEVVRIGLVGRHLMDFRRQFTGDRDEMGLA